MQQLLPRCECGFTNQIGIFGLSSHRTRLNYHHTCDHSNRRSFAASRSSRSLGVRGSQSLCWNATPALHCRDNNGGPVPLWMEGDRGGLTLTPVETYNLFFPLSSENKSLTVMVFTATMPPDPKINPSFPWNKMSQPPLFELFSHFKLAVGVLLQWTVFMFCPA